MTTLIGYFGHLITNLTKPLHELQKSNLKRLKRKPDCKARNKRSDEIGELAVSFSRMVNELSKNRKNIDSYEKGLQLKIKEKTDELNEKIKRA